jgi:hypothetical protein
MCPSSAEKDIGKIAYGRGLLLLFRVLYREFRLGNGFIEAPIPSEEAGIFDMETGISWRFLECRKKIIFLDQLPWYVSLRTHDDLIYFVIGIVKRTMNQRLGRLPYFS